ncbi:serine/threonine protein kinase [Sulfurimonas lithotrophica]|uniref:Serine/threonine protein kinase n=1 Tax=Sulfurimonas lithotrophica TaxID=2590022 RepID=A0A5P8NZS6_9BACT|nr:serine/threonine-protein kinase [Sulfurimonas lithotrophica]QFR48943.1 serine/threonine protein kinase [Sulfurimonas lithotrophica]
MCIIGSNKNKQALIEDIYENTSGIFNQRYIIVEYISFGGMSVVFKVKDIYCEYFNENKQLVIKIPIKNLLKKDDIAAFMYSEYTFLRDLNNENIVKVYDYGIDINTDIPYIVMEYLDGSLLENINLQNLKYKDKIFIFKNLHNTIRHIHKKGIIHADITPKNITVVHNKFITLFDFGISKRINTEKKMELDYNQAKAYNPKYSAPEIINGGKPTVESDLFSLALVLYEIFTTNLPFNINSLELEKKPLTFLNCPKQIPFILKIWFVKNLNINPKKRTNKLSILHKVII